MSKIAIEQTFDLGDGRMVTIETGKLAKQADGSVVVRQGDTMLLATVVSKKDAVEGTDFMPLSVDYQEKYAAAGRFPGGFFKREARPSEHEILVCRLVDRALRPLFPDDYHSETQVIINLISSDKKTAPDALAALAASSALAVSDIPFNGPISEVRVGRINGEFIVNPAIEDLENTDLDIIVAASMDNIMMVEGEMKEVSEDEMLEAIKIAHEAIKIQCQAQIDLAAKVEKSQVKRDYDHETNDEELRQHVYEATFEKALAAARKQIANKKLRSAEFDAVLDEYLESLSEEEREEKGGLIKRYYHDVHKKAARTMVLEDRTRLDGRQLDEIRPIWSEVDYLPSAHGSAIFTRGETQSLTTCTLGSKLDEQVVDGAVIEGKNSFILHYNFPPFSTGEAKFLRGTSRREVGHGNLALRALKPMLPDHESTPYTIRLVSDILESNGSSSMATVCAGTLALMDAGIQIKNPVTGIAMGLISDAETGKYAVLSDILGDEDHLGDMDFKVTGTREGITACQMDIKVDGLSYDVLKEALAQARDGRLHIMDKIEETLDTPRPDYKPHVPRIEKIIIPKDFIGAVIGPGGKVIQQIQAETGTTIVIEEIGDTGHVDIFSPDKESIEAAKEWVKNLTTVPEVGEVYKGKVKNITTFGAFVQILPNQEGLLHVSEIDWKRIDNVEEIYKPGDEVEVKLIEIDKKTGKLRLSRKALLPRPEGMPERAERPERRERRDRNDRNDRGDRRDRPQNRDRRDRPRHDRNN